MADVEYYQEDQFGQVRLVGRISLWFSFVALAGLLAIVVLAGLAESGPGSPLYPLAMTWQNLPWVMATGGTLLCLATALVTARIALYSSFRVAGPLYRFCHSLEMIIRRDASLRTGIRRYDYLQDEQKQLDSALNALQHHNRILDTQLELLIDELNQPEADPRIIEASLKQLRLTQHRVGIDAGGAEGSGERPAGSR